MWLSKKTIEEGFGKVFACSVGKVTVGGTKPCVLTDGEIRDTEIASFGGAVYIPKHGDEVLVLRGSEGESIVAARLERDVPEGALEGEAYITIGDGKIQINRRGEIIIEGSKVKIIGRTEICGELLINGKPCASATEG